MAKHQDDIVILGAGFSGLFTAYFLAQARNTANRNVLNNSKPTITVIDTASSICAGASGQAEGVLGNEGYEDVIQDLANMSDRMHKELAAQHDGERRWGFVGLNIYAVYSNAFSDPHTKLPFPVQREVSLEDLPRWLNTSPSWNAGLMSGPPNATRLDPAKYCEFLVQNCEDHGVKFMLDTTPVSVQAHHERKELQTITVHTKGALNTTAVPCQRIVLAAGSWSDRVFAQLFPRSKLSIPMVKEQPSQTWLRLRIADDALNRDKLVRSQVWLNEVLEDMDEYHISTFRDGEIYIAGDMDPPRDLPDTVDRVHAHKSMLNKLLGKAKLHLNTEFDDITLISSGRAYLPRTTSNLPILTKLTFDEIFPNHEDNSKQHPIIDETDAMDGKLFINTGQYLNVVILSAGCGKLISELVMGQKTSLDISPFKLPNANRKDYSTGTK